MSPYRPHNVARAFGTHWGLDLPEGCGLRPYRSGKSLLYSYYYHFLRTKGAQRSGKVEGRSPRGDKSRGGIGYAETDNCSQACAPIGPLAGCGSC